MATDLNLKHTFDPERRRQYLNGARVVLHCHHYATLYSQLALDAHKTDLLQQCAEECFLPLLDAVFAGAGADTVEKKLAAGARYFAAVGLGSMEVDGSTVTLARSHVDSGWVKKWGVTGTPVNYIGAGFVAGLFAAANGKPAGSYAVTETAGIAMGAGASTFTVAAR